MTGNESIEVAWGRVVSWPPSAPRTVVIDRQGEDQVLDEKHDGEACFLDWKEYSNLASMAALNEFNQHHDAQALALYQDAMSKFDGVGFTDIELHQERGHLRNL